MKHKIILFINLLAIIPLIFCNAVAVRAEKPARVLILPFTVHSDKDLTFLKDGITDMLSTRLTLEGELLPLSKGETEQEIKSLSESVDEQTAILLGRKLGADYVSYGSLTVFGDSISMDARFFDLHKNKTLVTFYESGKGHSDVIYHVNLFAGQISERVFGRKTFSPRPSRKTTSSDESRKHPDQIWKELKKKTEGTAAPVSEPLSVATVPDTVPGAVSEQAAGAVWKSRNFKIRIKGVAVGDVDGDGTNETVFISRKEVLIYRYLAGRFVKLGEVRSNLFHNHISVDVADINGNGKSEIFVTNMNNDRGMLLSFVLEWDGTEFAKIVDKSGWYYRVLNVPGKGNVLLGQKREVREIFAPGVYELKWGNGVYVSADRQILPEEINVFGFNYGDILNNGQEEIIAFTKNDYIRILGRDGNEEWNSGERFGGSATYIEFPAEASASIGNQKETDHFYLPQRILITDTDKDGKNEVIVCRNTDTTRRIFSRLRMFKSGHIECLGWESLGLYPKWTTRQISGYISDYVVGDMDNDGRNELVFSVVAKTSSVLGKAKSFIVSQEFPSKPEK